MFLRYVGGLVTVLVVICLLRKPISTYWSPHPWGHFARAFFGAFGGIAAVQAAATMPIAEATVIGLLDRIFVVLLAIAILGEFVGARHWVAVALCACGAFTVLAGRSTFSHLDTTYLVPAGIAFIGALLTAAESISIKMLSVKDVTLSIMLHVSVFGSLLLAIPAVVTWQSHDLALNGAFLLLGPFAIIGQLCIINGFRLADMSVVGPIGYTRVAFAAFLGIAFFGEVPNLSTVLGTVLIVGGGVWLSQLQRPRQDRAPKPDPTTAPRHRDTKRTAIRHSRRMGE